MKYPLFDIRSILSIPAMHRLFSKLVGGDAKEKYIISFVRPNEGDKILDIGCGTGDIIEYLPSVEYLGFDMNQVYIDAALKSFGKMGTFLCKKVSRDALQDIQFDIILANGVIHHLNDDEALQLFELARSTLKPNGRVVTLDNCYVEGQSAIARYLISMDRGKYVRNKEEYLAIASKVFPSIKISIRHDLMRIPYTHIVMECTS